MGVGTKKNISRIVILITLIFSIYTNIFAGNNWLEKDSKHFKIIYKPAHEYIVNHILNSAEKALQRLEWIFKYKPSGKIIINTMDVADYGYGRATSVPENYISLVIEPFENSYENLPYNERFQWLLNHELVHIIVNDQASKAESFNRAIFSKVQPERTHPISTFFSLLTNFSRFTPRWHQEGIAVFMETWLSGGFGRILGNFDEMYFRTMVLDKQKFPNTLELDAVYSHNSFLLANLFYLYGARFTTYLSLEYGVERLVKWYKIEDGDFYTNYEQKFKSIFGLDFSKAWQNFIKHEKVFQERNIAKLRSHKVTKERKLSVNTFGWVSNPHFDSKLNSVLFAYHHPNHLAGITELNLTNLKSNEINTLPTPSILKVASTAYDPTTKLFFYTTNNNRLYRDVRQLNIKSGNEKLLFKDARIGDLSVSPATHELWGIRHNNGEDILVISEFPYSDVKPIIKFKVGTEISNLSLSPDGKILAAVLHETDGSQSIILSDADEIKNNGLFQFKKVISTGSPDNPSWSLDGNTIFWNGYNNGVSNIYRFDLHDSQIQVLTNTLRGLFKPISLSKDSLLAFEFNADGFRPVKIANKPAMYLSAIRYMGEMVFEKNPELKSWNIHADKNINKNIKFFSNQIRYSGLRELNVLSFIPMISGFQEAKVLGFYTHIADPLVHHDFQIEAGYSPFNENKLLPKFHFKAKYNYMQKYFIEANYNAPDFYDLFNSRKRGMIGTKIRMGNKHYWVYDIPYKLVQKTDIALYTGVEYINDNLTKVSKPDFIAAQTILSSRYLRRSIGSSDFEKGNSFTLTLRGFGSDPNDPQYSGQVYGEWEHLSPWIANHNTARLKVMLGYHHDNVKLIQSRFYFGGFGNRRLENIGVKQYRKVFRFPGIPIYSLSADKFAKLMFENNFPPIRFSNISFGQQYLSHIDFSIYSQALLVHSPQASRWIDVGAQVNLVFKHWFNLESTFSFGYAKAWNEFGASDSWFFSYKLLKG